jgi:serine/threonine-protein kinase
MTDRIPDQEFITLQEALAGRYSLQRELGRGGMGIVYLAHEVALDRPVALKLLPPHMAADPTMRERFMREARTAAKLSQPNIVPIYTVDDVGGFVFFTMAYVDGFTLGSAIRERGALPPGEAVRILREVAWALAYAHVQGVVHRDVKPDNILVEVGSARALVTDFGIAQVRESPGTTGRGEVLGTAEFMSPEQASGETVDERSDIYSLGVVGYYMLSGRVPFGGETAAAVLAKHITQAAPLLSSVAPEVPKHLAQAIDRCLARAPADRFANAEDLAMALSQSIEVRREMPVPLRVFLKQNRERLSGLPLWALFVAYAAVVALVAGVSGEPIIALFMLSGALVMGVVPIGMLLRMARQLLGSGYGRQELLLALKDDLQTRKEELAFERGGETNWVDRMSLGLMYGGLAAMGVGTALAYILDLNAISDLVLGGLGALTAGGLVASLVGIPLTAVRGGSRRGLPGKWWSKFWESRVGKWLFKAAGVRLKGLPNAGSAYGPTELAIGMAAERLFEELPKAAQKDLEELPELVNRLEKDALGMRQRIEELNGMLFDIGGEGDSGFSKRAASVVSNPDLRVQRDQVKDDLERARDGAQVRLQDAVASLETIRLGLLRLHAGSGTVGGITQDLTNASEIAGDIERLLEGRSEVEAALKGAGEEPLSSGGSSLSSTQRTDPA